MTCNTYVDVTNSIKGLVVYHLQTYAENSECLALWSIHWTWEVRCFDQLYHDVDSDGMWELGYSAWSNLIIRSTSYLQFGDTF